MFAFSLSRNSGHLLIERAKRSSTASAPRYRYHLYGAIGLLQLRGEAQFSDPLSLQLFRTIRTQMVRLLNTSPAFTQGIDKH